MDGHDDGGQADSARRDGAAALISRGVRRALAARGLVSLTEFTLANNRRADIIALDPKGIITIVEIKSGAADFRADNKWREYLDWCDAFLFAVDEMFPLDLIPADVGLLIADGYGAHEHRPAVVSALPPARRKALTMRIALTAAGRLHRFEDPGLTESALAG